MPCRGPRHGPATWGKTPYLSEHSPAPKPVVLPLPSPQGPCSPHTPSPAWPRAQPGWWQLSSHIRRSRWNPCLLSLELWCLENVAEAQGRPPRPHRLSRAGPGSPKPTFSEGLVTHFIPSPIGQVLTRKTVSQLPCDQETVIGFHPEDKPELSSPAAQTQSQQV